MKLSYLFVLMLAAGMSGCDYITQPQPDVPHIAFPDMYDQLFFRLRYTTVLSQDTTAILGCFYEDKDSAECRKVCEADKRLTEFERSHALLMAIDRDTFHAQHKWCPSLPIPKELQ